ncbi:galactose-3-O-sulfotransferase 2 [Crotalus adamanteus]|uniref:Galactose-3-O-sulfotransferase 2 n=1 Tax=Crotalus adamanteus TaxID=8729 RepID=A0AAW1BFR7_CROAD
MKGVCWYFQRFLYLILWLAGLTLIGFFQYNTTKDIKQKHPSKICQPITDVMFLKTHKTASSTILNILYRFSEKHNLTIALPYGNEPHLGYPTSKGKKKKKEVEEEEEEVEEEEEEE